MGAVCKRHGALLIYDEVMVGFFRTGRMYAWEHDGYAPDILVLGKSLGAGEQGLSAVLCNKDVENSLCQGTGHFSHGFTFQNNAVACAAACEVLSIIQKDRLLDNINRLGFVIITGLRKELGNHPYVGDIRGLGFFVGVSRPSTLSRLLGC